MIRAAQREFDFGKFHKRDCFEVRRLVFVMLKAAGLRVILEITPIRFIRTLWLVCERVQVSPFRNFRTLITAVITFAAVCLTAEISSAQTCSVTSASGSFGTVDVLLGTAVDSSSNFTVSCSGSSNATVRLCIEFGRGASAAGPRGERALTSGSNALDFDFYSDPAKTQLWGSWGIAIVAYGSGGVTYDLSLGPTGSATKIFTAYARIAANQANTPPSTYSWNGASPGLVYGYKSSLSCPTGSSTTTSSGTSWDATVLAGCSISASAMNFGSNSSNISSNVDSSANINVLCTNTTPYSLGLGAGLHSSAGQRRMSVSSSAFIIYELYTDAGRTSPWKTSSAAVSCTNGVGSCVLGTGSGSAQSMTVWGRVPPQTAQSAGTFSDTIVMTINY